MIVWDEPMDKRILISIALGIVMIVMAIFLVMNGEDLLQQRIVVSYSDGCVEEYINGVIQTAECIEPFYFPPGDYEWNLNTTNLG